MGSKAWPWALRNKKRQFDGSSVVLVVWRFSTLYIVEAVTTAFQEFRLLKPRPCVSRQNIHTSTGRQAGT